MRLHCDRDKCYFCDTKEPKDIPKNKGFRRLIEAHHMIERNEGGDNSPSNLCPCCSSCHSKIHLELIKLDKWLNFGYCYKLHWWDEKSKEYFGPYYDKK